MAQALAILEGEEVAEPLFDSYQRATDRMLLIRGRRRLGEPVEPRCETSSHYDPDPACPPGE